MTDRINPSRRHLLLGGLSLTALGAVALGRPRDLGQGAHKPYFKGLSEALDRGHLAQPTLVIDKAILEKNIKTLKKNIGGRFDYRIVAKSLPSIPLLEMVMKGADTQRLMLFHQPFLNQVAKDLPHADVLMGKPMPIAAAANFYRQHKTSGGFDADQQLQWLVDTPERVRQYQQLAHQLKVSMRLNIELDVGLHRGGVKDDAQLEEMLALIEADPTLTLAGFMGYDAHITKLPGSRLAARDRTMEIYTAKLELARRITGRTLDDLTLNGAGSPTYQFYAEGDFPHNELSMGSCLVKPTDFDLPQLADHQPAAFVATPVIKSQGNTELPGPALLPKLMTLWNPNRAKAFYTYGGNWQATPESPAGLSYNPIWGHSSNQEMLNGSSSVTLKEDDWVFFRPSQSEAVFLQFGDIAVYDQGEIVERWPVLTESSALT